MFDIYYRGLSDVDKADFQRRSGLTADVIKNSYTRPDPLKRNMPRPETMVKMIQASGYALQPLALVEFFYLQIVMELLRLDPEYEKHLDDKVNKVKEKAARLEANKLRKQKAA